MLPKILSSAGDGGVAIKYPAMSIHDRVMKQMSFIQIALWYIKFDFPYYSIGIYIYNIYIIYIYIYIIYFYNRANK